MNPSPPDPSSAEPSTEELSAEDRKQRVLIITARKAEYDDVLTDEFSRKLIQNHPYWARETDQFQIRLTHVGVGKDQARKTLGDIQSILEGDLLIIAGTAGALHHDLNEGDIYLPTALAPTDAVTWSHPDQELLHWLVGWLENEDFVDRDPDMEREANLRLGPMVTSPRPVINEEQRTELRELTGAMAVDMESTHILEQFDHSQDEEDQWVGLRVISDGASTETASEAERKQSKACRRLNQLLKRLIVSLQQG